MCVSAEFHLYFRSMYLNPKCEYLTLLSNPLSIKFTSFVADGNFKRDPRHSKTLANDLVKNSYKNCTLFLWQKEFFQLLNWRLLHLTWWSFESLLFSVSSTVIPMVQVIVMNEWRPRDCWRQSSLTLEDHSTFHPKRKPKEKRAQRLDKKQRERQTQTRKKPLKSLKLAQVLQLELDQPRWREFLTWDIYI